MQMKHLAAVCALSVPLVLSAQDLPSRVGLQVGVVMPQGDMQGKLGQGYALGLSIHFNREATHEGRLRIEQSQMPEKSSIEPDTYNPAFFQEVKRSAHTLAVGYDWMPGNERVRAILGLGGMFWYQEWKVTHFSGATTRDDAVGFAVVPTLGLQVRFNRYVGLEARYALAHNNVDKQDLNTQMDHVVVGLEFRF